MKGTPIVTEMKVIPVAGHDSMTMTLSGAHAPYFTRNVVILKDNSGNTGIGEVHGGEYITKSLESYKQLVVGQEIGNYRSVINSIRRASYNQNSNKEGIEKLHIDNLKFVVQAESAVEAAMLDLLGKYMNLPVCALLGDGQQRDEVTFLGYLFYISDKAKTDLPYIDESDSKDVWYRIRRKETLTPEALLEQAKALKAKYGFKDFKLKAGVLSGQVEMETVRQLKKELPDARINIDPNGAWSLEESIELCKGMNNILTYVEDPCGPENGYSGREILSEFKTATGFQVATNMIANNWRQFHHAMSLKSIDILLADPHFWTMNGSVRIAQLLNDWGLTWGSHSNNHFDISLAMFVHCAAAAPGNITPVDTHWIWQEGKDDLCKNSMKIKDGKIKVPNTSGLGIDIDMDRVIKAHELYNTMNTHDRDDSISMQYLIPNWKFNPKKPALVR